MDATMQQMQSAYILVSGHIANRPKRLCLHRLYCTAFAVGNLVTIGKGRDKWFPVGLWGEEVAVSPNKWLWRGSRWRRSTVGAEEGEVNSHKTLA
jgi:hypothetical protein